MVWHLESFAVWIFPWFVLK